MLVILYMRRRQHEKALRTLVVDIGNMWEAEQYCIDNPLEQDLLRGGGPGGEQRSLLVVLLQTLLGAAEEAVLVDGNTGMPMDTKAEVLRILHVHSLRIDPVQALRLLPDDMRLADVTGYLLRVIPHVTHTHRDTQVQKALWKSQYLHTETEHAKLVQRSVVITNYTECAVDRQRIGEKWFAVYPNNRIVLKQNQKIADERFGYTGGTGGGVE